MSLEFRLHKSDKHESVYREDSLLLAQAITERVDFNSLFDTGNTESNDVEKSEMRTLDAPYVPPVETVRIVDTTPVKRKKKSKNRSRGTVKQLSQGEGLLSMIRNKLGTAK